MSLSSIHIDNNTSSMGIHNTRVFSPDYLIIADKSVNDYKSYTKEHIEDLVIMAKADYKAHQKYNRSIPKNATLIKEGLVNLNDYHKIEDVELVKDMLEKKYGYKVTNISIHRDEGYIFNDKKNFTMGREQFTNIEETPYIAELDFKDNKFYEWKKEKGKWKRLEEVTDYEMKFNYHAHIEMLNYDFEKHRTVRNNIKTLSRMQTLVADMLKMTRGKCSSTVEAELLGVEVEESRKRMNIKDYKNYKRKINELELEKEELKKENEELKKYDFKEMQKTITALENLSSSQKRELHQLNSAVKNNRNKIEELEEALESAKTTIISNENEKTAYRQSIEDLKKEIHQKDDLIFGMKINYGKLEKEKVNYIERNESLEKEKERLISFNEIKPKEIIKTIEVENPINTKLQADVSDKNEQINTLQEEKEKLEKRNDRLNLGIKEAIAKIATALKIPVINNFSFFDIAVNHFKALQEQLMNITTKDTTSQEKINPRASEDALEKILNQYDEAVSQKNSEEDISEAMKEFKRRDDYK